jgi:hypothetical protein
MSGTIDFRGRYHRRKRPLPCRTKPRRADPSRAIPSRTLPNLTEPSRTRPRRVGALKGHGWKIPCLAAAPNQTTPDQTVPFLVATRQAALCVEPSKGQDRTTYAMPRHALPRRTWPHLLYHDSYLLPATCNVQPSTFNSALRHHSCGSAKAGG